uniref:Piwi domain-containing protein n=1 Tax=Glossina pallidipes TaxID=7398 RepID=A0A1A9ZRF5_GLOPL
MLGYGRGLRRNLPQSVLSTSLEASCSDSDKIGDNGVGIQSSGLTNNIRRIGFGRRGKVLPSGSHKVPALGATASSDDTIATNCQDRDKLKEAHPKDIVKKEGSHKVPALGATASSDDTISTNSQGGGKSKEGHPKDLVKKEGSRKVPALGATASSDDIISNNSKDGDKSKEGHPKDLVKKEGSHKVPALGATTSSDDIISNNSKDGDKSKEGHPKDLVKKERYHKVPALGATASSDDTTSTNSQGGDKSKQGHPKDLVKKEGYHKVPVLGATASSDDTTPTHSQDGDKSKEGHPKDLVKKEHEKTSSLLTSPKTTQGTKGTPINLVSNYIRISSDPNKGIYVYEVRFIPNIDSKRLRRQYLNEHSVKFGGTKTFDGVILYLPILLNDKLTTYISKAYDGSDIEIRILFKRKELLKDCIQFYNVLFDRIMKTLNYVRFDRKQFDPASSIVLPQHQLEVWPGYVTAVNEHEGGLLLCCDVSHRLLCQKTISETLIEIFRRKPKNFQETAKKALLGTSVITRYNNKTYRIDDICFEKNPQSTFTFKEGTVSFLDYYQKNYNIEIKDKNQPLLISIKKQRMPRKSQEEDLVICLIPELCYETGLRDDIRTNHKLMREIAMFTRLSPTERINALKKFYTNINNSPASRKILSDWGLSLVQNYEEISGRQLGEERVYFDRKQVSVGPKADFSKYVVNNKLLDAIAIENWLLIYCEKDSKVAISFCERIRADTNSFGMRVERPQIVTINNDRIESYKIALQMNCKLGGSLWSVKIPFKQKVMICGIDVYHETVRKENSVAAFVASLNENYTKFYSKAMIQNQKEEIISGLSYCLISALNAYRNKNNFLPHNIIIYRDGVGDGQMQICEQFEIPQLEEACRRTLNHKVKITFIVVQKRINTRFFLTDGDCFQNPNPGTVVDKVITRAACYDFFLVTQVSKQGATSPTHYVVLRDDAEFGPDIIQRLTYKLCFLYFNWPGTISVPACCQYAHKMALFVGQTLKTVPSEDLLHNLFYL